MRQRVRATTAFCLATTFTGQAVAFVTPSNVAKRNGAVHLGHTNLNAFPPPLLLPHRSVPWRSFPLKSSSSSSLEQSNDETNVCPFGRFFNAVRSFPFVRSGRKLLSTLFVSLTLVLGLLRVGRGGFVPPAHASTPTRTATSCGRLTTRVISSSSSSSSRWPLACSQGVERLVEKYVEDHMFGDDVYEPFESAYREAYYDRKDGDYPDRLDAALSEASTAATGERASLLTGRSRGEVILRRLGRFFHKLERQYGIPQLVTVPIFSISVIVLPFTLLLRLLYWFSESQRKAEQARTISRYGDAAGLDATELRERQIAQEDDDDDDDDEDDDDDDDDDEDD